MKVGFHDQLLCWKYRPEDDGGASASPEEQAKEEAYLSKLANSVLKKTGFPYKQRVRGTEREKVVPGDPPTTPDTNVSKMVEQQRQSKKILKSYSNPANQRMVEPDPPAQGYADVAPDPPSRGYGRGNVMPDPPSRGYGRVAPDSPSRGYGRVTPDPPSRGYGRQSGEVMPDPPSRGYGRQSGEVMPDPPSRGFGGRVSPDPPSRGYGRGPLADPPSRDFSHLSPSYTDSPVLGHDGTFAVGTVLRFEDNSIGIYKDQRSEKDYEVVYILQANGTVKAQGIALDMYDLRVIGKLPPEFMLRIQRRQTWDRDEIIYHLTTFDYCEYIPHPIRKPERPAPAASTRPSGVVAKEPAADEPGKEKKLIMGRYVTIKFGEKQEWQAVYWGVDDLGTIIAHRTHEKWALMHMDLRRFKDSLTIGDMADPTLLSQISDDISKG